MASQKLTELSALATPAGEDLVYVVDDPSGTPASRKITLASLFNAPPLVANLGSNWNVYALGFGMFRVIRVLTNAQVLGLPDSVGPAELVPRVAGAIVIPVVATLALDWTADYASINGSGNIRVQSPDGGLYLASQNEAVDGLVSTILAPGLSVLQLIQPSSTPDSGLAPMNLEGLELASNNGGADYTGGNAANTLTISVDYAVTLF